MNDIKVVKTREPKAKPDFQNLGFGNFFSDHMFIMQYSEEKAWHDPRIIPYTKLEIDPACMVLHYGQAVFEGLKAYKNSAGEICLFRPDKNIERINSSCERLCIPVIDVNLGIQAIKKLVDVEKDWIPSEEGTSLYIRPFIFGDENFLGVRPSKTYKFIIICSPSGAYYKEGINPVRIFVEEEYVRAVRGGVGFAKTEANYASSLKAQEKAGKKGFSQVLWLDGVERKYIEEVGTMNVFFVIDDEVITPSLEGSILPGITRMSVIELLRSMGRKVVERRLSIDEVVEANRKGALKEAFGTGTAAVISPVGELNYNGEQIILNGGLTGDLTKEIYDMLTGIQYGRLKDEFGWLVRV